MIDRTSDVIVCVVLKRSKPNPSCAATLLPNEDLRDLPASSNRMARSLETDLPSFRLMEDALAVEVVPDTLRRLGREAGIYTTRDTAF